MNTFVEMTLASSLTIDSTRNPRLVSTAASVGAITSTGMGQKLAAVTENAAEKFAGESLDDDALIEAHTRQGDLNAFNELVLKYQNLAYGIAFRLLLSREAAADAVQESFIRAF